MLDNRIVSAYIECALWSSIDSTLYVHLDEYELSEFTKRELTEQVTVFFTEQRELIEQFIIAHNSTYDNVAHLFWLSCNGHGAGFFDYNSQAAADLDVLCGWEGIYHGTELYLGDDEEVYHA